MKVRLFTFAVTFIVVYFFRPLLGPIISGPSVCFGLCYVAWQAAYLINRNYTMKKLIGPINGDGKAVLITGCDTGFGHLLALKMANRGFHVFACCLNDKSEDSKKLLKNHTNISLIKLDVTKESEFLNAREKVKDILEDKRLKLHGIVNNAGIAYATLIALVDGPDISDFERMFQVNFFSILRTIRTFLPLLNDDARIVNLTSCAAFNHVTWPELNAYFCTKSAASALTSGLRTELSRLNVKVIEIRPWFYKTPLLSTNFCKGPLIEQIKQIGDQRVLKFYGSNFAKKMTEFYDWFFNSNFVNKDVNEVVEELENALVSFEPDTFKMIASNNLYGLLKCVVDVLPREIVDIITDIKTRLTEMIF